MNRAVAADLFRGEGSTTRLLAGLSKADGHLRFPPPTGPEAARYDVVELGTRGTLWSWTVQRFPPKPPYDGAGEREFRPYAVGYVELPGELIVESRIVVDDFATLRIGQPMRLTTEAYRHDAEGAVLTYAFTPDTSKEAVRA